MADWTEPAWLEEAHAWIDLELGRLGLEQEGAAEQPHVRPWATDERTTRMWSCPGKLTSAA